MIEKALPNEPLIIHQKALSEGPEITLDLANLDPQQLKYLEVLSKYSSRKNKIKIIGVKDIPKRKQVYIQQNFGYLSINDQVQFNDADVELGKHEYNGYMIAFGTFMLTFGYYIIKTPLTRSLMKEGFKSLAIGGILGYGYYRVNYESYLNKIHKFYVQVINEKRLRRVTRGEMDKV
jgi:hypothetical protein